MRRAAGSFGSRQGANWHREGADYRKRREAALSDTSAGQADSLHPTSTVALRRAIEAQVCPWCGHGPYKVMAMHTHRAHGVSGAELRQLAGLNAGASICSPVASQDARDRLVGRSDFSVTTAKATRMSVEAGAQAAAKGASVRKTLERNAERHAEILRLHRANPSIQLSEIGAIVGMHPRSVKNILRGAGVDVGDYRAVVAKERNRPTQALAARAYQEAAAVRARQRLDRYWALGGDWAAVGACASEWGLSPKQTRAYLRKHGAVVPDGRRIPR